MKDTGLQFSSDVSIWFWYQIDLSFIKLLISLLFSKSLLLVLVNTYTHNYDSER